MLKVEVDDLGQGVHFGDFEVPDELRQAVLEF
jgi:hypothetical protein